MKILSALFAVVFTITAAWAVELTKDDVTTIQKQVVTTMDQYNSGNLDALLDAMPSSAITLFGGRDQMKTMLDTAFKTQKQQNISFESITTGEIGKPFMAGTTTLCFVPTVSMMKVGDKRIRGVGFMIASRAQGEKQWKLLSGDGLAKAPQMLPMIFPGAPEKVEMPPVKYDVIP